MARPVTSAAAKAARVGAKYAVKYGPQVALAWKIGGPKAIEAATAQRERLLNRRHAVDKADTVVDGSVLRTRDGEQVIWVVFSGDEPVASYPPLETPLSEYVAHDDLGKRRTPAEIRRARPGARAKRAALGARRGDVGGGV